MNVYTALSLVITLVISGIVFGIVVDEIQDDPFQEVLAHKCDERFGEGNWTMHHAETSYCRDDETGETLGYDDIQINMTSQASYSAGTELFQPPQPQG